MAEGSDRIPGTSDPREPEEDFTFDGDVPPGALAKGLRLSETRYVRSARSGTVDLRFSKSGDPEIEWNYRPHYVSPALSGRKQERLREKLSKTAQPVVFKILRDSRCSECGAGLGRGSFLLMEAGQPLCLACAGLGDLEYLPSGDAALTRCAGKYSGRTAVVVRFSRSRARYERQASWSRRPGWRKPSKNARRMPGSARQHGRTGPRNAAGRISN